MIARALALALVHAPVRVNNPRARLVVGDPSDQQIFDGKNHQNIPFNARHRGN